ncbi:hypothetical protein [Alkalihalobacillus sp. AL-G]|uniref:hypothetical protein n=1 Tax=Alkalihalobacillus sp. AL-G TaxID=2926399 RepID=UPI00272B8E87|nr:hypothetical protein [Alkalihalobacillus sp. AL-G]WLD94357.1 hypothetical protein MOJ78_05570 [Alkalihalobacillus sp. AL-G]
MSVFSRLRHYKEARLGLALLLIPLLISILFMWPYHVEFIAKGDIASVQELGVDGSVNFTYVYSGVTETLWDRIDVMTVYGEDLQFYPLENYTYEEYLASGEMAEGYKEATVVNAVEYASATSDSGKTNALNDRVQEILSESTNYIGDSFGLMLSIGLVEEWEDVDFSQDGKYKIAGTGAMAADNTVGSVGAIRHKLLTAEENQVDVFFVPADKAYYIDPTFSNEYEAEQVMEEEDLQLKVVPVTTLDEALTYLENLP